MPATRKVCSAAHNTIPEPKRVKCYAWWCSKTFNRAADMRRHCDHKHLGFFYQCTFCGYKCAQKDAVETHVSNVHTRELTSVCSCGQGFTDPSTLCRHRKETGHARNNSTKRGSSGAVIRGRELGTGDLTRNRIMDTSYIPALFAEDDFTFSRFSSAGFCYSDSSSSITVCSSSEESNEYSTSLLTPPTSMSSSINFDVMETISPAPQLYRFDVQTESSNCSNDSEPQMFGASLDQFYPPCNWDPQSFSLNTENFSSLFPTFLPPQYDLEYAKFDSNLVGHELQSVPGNVDPVPNFQDAFLNYMIDWAQGANGVHYDFSHLAPVQQSPSFHFTHDLNIVS